jgi:diacylglycerol kinase (ATP)
MQQNSCLFSFANTPTFGGGLRIAPQAEVADGLLDCVLVDAMSTPQLIRRVPSLLNGTVLGLKEVTFVRAKTLQIHSDPPAWVYADGESVCQTPINVRVLRHAMRVLADN